MNMTLDKKTNWWGEPMVWLLIALPLSAVIGGGLTIWLAASNADTLVNEAHVKEGFAVRQVLDRDKRAAELGLQGTLNAEPGRLTLDLAGRTETLPSSLVLNLTHPTDPAQDIVLMLQQDGNGRYSAVYASIPEGKRLLELTPPDKSWRITGQWQAPFTGSAQLAAVTQISSTQP